MNKMETKIVTLRENHSLVALSIYTSKTTIELTDIIIYYLIKEDCFYDIPEECGEMLETILTENDHTLYDLADHCFKYPHKILLETLQGIQLWGLENDCDDCGCEMRYDDISEHNECRNDACGCSINMDNSPDPDEYRDDCMLSNPIKLNYISYFNLN